VPFVSAQSRTSKTSPNRGLTHRGGDCHPLSGITLFQVWTTGMNVYEQ
jgi:hypothetical protein